MTPREILTLYKSNIRQLIVDDVYIEYKSLLVLYREWPHYIYVGGVGYSADKAMNMWHRLNMDKPARINNLHIEYQNEEGEWVQTVHSIVPYPRIRSGIRHVDRNPLNNDIKNLN